MKLTIERSRWLHGEGSTASYLLRQEDQKMCCIGFYACALGANPSTIESLCNPGDVPEAFEGKADWLLADETSTYEINSEDACTLMNANDQLKEGDRETVIAEIFAKHGVEVEFVD